MYQALLFDLDGTLTASGEGITKSIQYALRKMGYESLAEDLKKLEVFVGPPLLEQLMEYCQIEEPEAEQGVAYYRNVTMWLDIMRINLIRGFASFCQN